MKTLLKWVVIILFALAFWALCGFRGWLLR